MGEKGLKLAVGDEVKNCLAATKSTLQLACLILSMETVIKSQTC